jgi:hypothetical protein
MLASHQLEDGIGLPVALDAENDPFLSDYAEHVNNQIQNPGAAESKVPFTLVGNYDYLDVWNHDRLVAKMLSDPYTDDDARALAEYGI